MGRGADDGGMEIAMILFVLLVGPFAVVYGADSRRS
jgi:hypothetical protein